MLIQYLSDSETLPTHNSFENPDHHGNVGWSLIAIAEMVASKRW